jgi:hypothetical protein
VGDHGEDGRLGRSVAAVPAAPPLHHPGQGACRSDWVKWRVPTAGKPRRRAAGGGALSRFRRTPRAFRIRDPLAVHDGPAGATPAPAPRRARVALVLALGAISWVVPPTAAQPYAAFDVPDSLMAEALRSAAAGFENAWNALLVSELRARAAAADCARLVRAGTRDPESVGDLGALGATLHYLGLVQRQLGHADSARATFVRALETTVAAGDSGRTADVLVSTIALLSDAGQHGRALALGDRAASIYAAGGNLRGEAQPHRPAGPPHRRSRCRDRPPGTGGRSTGSRCARRTSAWRAEPGRSRPCPRPAAGSTHWRSRS